LDLALVYRWVDEHKDECIEALRTLVRQPSCASQNLGVSECAALLVNMMKSIGMEASAIGAGGQPFVVGKVASSKSPKTLVVYNHYDVQPPEPVEEWKYPPFSATLDGGKIYGRGTTDSKGNLMAHLLAVKAYKQVHGDVPVNVKYLFDGEEEISSPTITRFVAENKDMLKADAAMSLDGGFDASNRPRIQFGSSGMEYVEIRATGSTAGDLHSARARLVENPAWKLVWLLSTMKDRNERILIEGFYDDVRGPTPEERKLLEINGWDDEKQMGVLGVKKFLTGVTGVAALQRLLYQPTCNIAGISSGYTILGGRKTVLPAKAFVKIDCRLVPNQRPEDIFQKIKRHVGKQNLEGIEVKDFGGVAPSHAPLESDISTAVINAAKAVYPQGPGLQPRGDASGKQGPWLGTQLGIPGVSSGIGPPDWHGHAPNEVMTVEHFLNGIKYVATIYANYAAV
jgi:acetylornithine deacetylase/succinyl-diaminopimelate desuccinylase-like protein